MLLPCQVKELGRGQFGSVLLARWLGVDVAVKELRNSADAHSNAEMLRVSKLAGQASAKHPAICKVQYARSQVHDLSLA